MAGLFDITAPTNTVLLDSKRQATTAFTVSNNSGRQIRGRAQVVAQNQQAQSWLTLIGEAERDFAIAGAEQYSIQIVVPLTATPGIYSFRLDTVNLESANEELSEGPAVQFTVPAPPTHKKGLPLWIPLTAVVALLLVSIAYFFVQRGRNSALAAEQTMTAVQSGGCAGLAATGTAAAFVTGTAVASSPDSAAAAGTATQTALNAVDTWVSSVTLAYRHSSYDLRLLCPGLIEVRITESQVSPLAVSISDSDGVVVAQSTGEPPFIVSHTVTAAEFAAGDSWRVDIVDPANGSEYANGTVQITYPSGSRVRPLSTTFGSTNIESEHASIIVMRQLGLISATAEWAEQSTVLNMSIEGGGLNWSKGNSSLSLYKDVTRIDDGYSDTYMVYIYNSDDAQTTHAKITVKIRP